jgi:hypothetical protein
MPTRPPDPTHQTRSLQRQLHTGIAAEHDAMLVPQLLVEVGDTRVLAKGAVIDTSERRPIFSVFIVASADSLLVRHG